MSLIISFLTSGIRRLLGDWRVLLMIIVLGIAGMGLWKLKRAEEQVQQAKQEAAQLAVDYAKAKAANDQNALVIKQLEADKQALLGNVQELNSSIQQINAKVASLKAGLNGVNAKPAPLSPFISRAITDVQGLSAASGAPR